jgi:hypothetical protein
MNLQLTGQPRGDLRSCLGRGVGRPAPNTVIITPRLDRDGVALPAVEGRAFAQRARRWNISVRPRSHLHLAA